MKPGLRIACFLPAATEMVCALGLLDQLVGVSQECDYPPEVRQKPVVVHCAMDLKSLNLSQIDQAVSARAAQGQSIYAVEEAVLLKVSPNLIVTQDLCQVCAPSGNEATQVLKSMTPAPEILWQTPHSFEEILKDLLALGEKTGTLDRAQTLVWEAEAKIEKIKISSASLTPVRVFFMEWVDPIFCGGHWVPDLIHWAGGTDPLSKSGMDSIRIPWEKVSEMDPEVLVVAPCGFNGEKALEQAELLKSRPGYAGLSAVRNRRVWAVDANSFFARPSLRLVTGLEILAHLFHPKVFPAAGPPGAFSRVD